jgi:hypothetical protein
MGSRVCIDDFSVMTSLDRNALRQYHDLGLLVPSPMTQVKSILLTSSGGCASWGCPYQTSRRS